MALKQVIEIIDFLDSAKVTGRQVGELFTCRGWAGWEVETIESDKGSTDFITVALPGSEGRRAGGNAPTLGIIGRLGAIGGRAVMIKWQCWGRIVRPGHRLGLCSSREAFFFGLSSGTGNQMGSTGLEPVTSSL